MVCQGEIKPSIDVVGIIRRNRPAKGVDGVTTLDLDVAYSQPIPVHRNITPQSFSAGLHARGAGWVVAAKRRTKVNEFCDGNFTGV